MFGKDRYTATGLTGVLVHVGPDSSGRDKHHVLTSSGLLSTGGGPGGPPRTDGIVVSGPNLQSAQPASAADWASIAP
jgi:hypothetical protein